jgi:hypothetical protein
LAASLKTGRAKRPAFLSKIIVQRIEKIPRSSFMEVMEEARKTRTKNGYFYSTPKRKVYKRKKKIWHFMQKVFVKSVKMCHRRPQRNVIY